jgi:hypothetical protein
MLNPPLFPVEMTDAQIAAPYFYQSLKELVHSLKQVGARLEAKHENACIIAHRYAQRKRKPYFVRFAVWPDGTWACLFDERFRDPVIAPGQLKTAYFSSCRDKCNCLPDGKEKHFYNLETNTTSDLILRT